MKKICLLLICLLTFTACSSNHYSSVSDGDEVIYKDGSGNAYTKKDLYESMKSNDITDSLKITLINKLAALEGVDIDTITSEVEESVNALVDGGYESFIISYYGSVDNYQRSYIANQALNALAKSYVESNFNSYVESYNPYKAEIVYFDEKDSAQAVLDAVGNEENTFEYACTENGYDSEVSETLYTDTDSDLPVDVKEYVLNATDTGLSDIIEVTTTTTDSDGNSTVNSRYYLVNLISKNVEDFKDEFVEKVVSDVDKDTIINTLLEKYNFETHDQRVYELLKETYEATK